MLADRGDVHWDRSVRLGLAGTAALERLTAALEARGESFAPAAAITLGLNLAARVVAAGEGDRWRDKPCPLVEAALRQHDTEAAQAFLARCRPAVPPKPNRRSR
jgi:hypothetical protein